MMVIMVEGEFRTIQKVLANRRSGVGEPENTETRLMKTEKIELEARMLEDLRAKNYLYH